MSASFQTVALEGEAAAALPAVPARPGVAQILGPEGRNLLIGRPANLRRWAAHHLGQSSPKPGKRPPTDLRPVATAVRYAVTTSAFQQRLVHERLLAEHVPLRERKDLKRPVSLHLDALERFPRVTLGPAGAEGGSFGPFRDRAAAKRALAGLHKRFALRPCDYVFEPHPELPLGLACLYFQTRTCVAPCLGRVGEEEYRALAASAARFLAHPWERPEEVSSWLPGWVAGEAGSRGLIVEGTRAGLELYPVREWTVLDDQGVRARHTEVEAAVSALRWDAPEGGRDDRPWLLSWLSAGRGGARYLPVRDTSDRAGLAAAVSGALCRAAAPRR